MDLWMGGWIDGWMDVIELDNWNNGGGIFI